MIAGTSSVDVPAEVRPFIEAGTLPIALEGADLNGDGRPDYVLVLERQKSRPSDPEIEHGQRPLLVLVRRADGSLQQAARNTGVVLCSTCGGMMGDPFQGVEAGTKTFTVSHYGGSAWRWGLDYKFNYSRRDDTWQLVGVEETSFHAAAPEEGKSRTYVPPADFGKIDIADFDPETWKAAPALPAAALQAIAAVRSAAQRQDFDALRALLNESEFTSSFGGDGGADEAIASWRQEPALLAELARVTAQPCALVEGYVECPREAGTGYRAGFKLGASGWRMQWFVAGD